MVRDLFHLGTRVLAITAAAASAFMIITPANATTSNISEVVLQDPTSGAIVLGNGDSGVSAVNTGAVQATMSGFGTFTCSYATSTGVLHTGATGGASNPYLEFSSIDITGCSGPGGVDLSVRATCPVEISADPNSSPPSVAGHMDAGTSTTPCVQAYDTNTGGSLCTLDIGGITNADFDETTQELTISGSGLSIVSAGGLCGYLAGQAITLSVPFGLAPDSPYASDVIHFIP